MTNVSEHTFVILTYKETPLLKRCVKSVLEQSTKTNVVIATSTPNDYIKSIADEFDLPLIVNPERKGIGHDFNFALNCVDTDIVTIAHQDDIYENNYAAKISENAKDNPTASIIFTDYYEIRNGEKIFTNANHKIKNLLLKPLKTRCLKKTKFSRRFALAFGNAISCPSVSFIKNNLITKDIFLSDMKSNVDWYAWEKLSQQKNPFVYIPIQLVGHTISENTTTSDIINQGIRTQEDYYMFKKFWPSPIAKLLQKVYSTSEKGNEVKE